MSSRPDRRNVLAGGLAILAAVGLPATRSSAQSRSGGARMSVTDARAAQRRGSLVIVDIRRPEEWAASGVPEGAYRIDMRSPEFPARLMDLRQSNPDARIGLICATGGRSAYVEERLREMGVNWTVDVRGGVVGPGEGWIAKGLPVEH